jgi:CheY-like chemotaxis protein
MPGIDGLELLDQLRANGIKTPAIMITGAGITGNLVSASKRLDAMLLVSVREHVASGESVVIQERRLAVGEAADVDAGEPRTL